MCRVLRPGKRVAISVWESPKRGNGLGLLFGALKIHGDLNVPLPHGPDFFQFSEVECMTDALTGLGLRDIRVQSVNQSWSLDEPLGLIHAVLEGAVRARALLLAQTDSARAAVEKSIADQMSQFTSGDGTFEVPMPAIVGAGTV